MSNEILNESQLRGIEASIAPAARRVVEMQKVGFDEQAMAEAVFRAQVQKELVGSPIWEKMQGRTIESNGHVEPKFPWGRTILAGTVLTLGGTACAASLTSIIAPHPDQQTSQKTATAPAGSATPEVEVVYTPVAMVAARPIEQVELDHWVAKLNLAGGVGGPGEVQGNPLITVTNRALETIHPAYDRSGKLDITGTLGLIDQAVANMEKLPISQGVKADGIAKYFDGFTRDDVEKVLGRLPKYLTVDVVEFIRLRMQSQEASVLGDFIALRGNGGEEYFLQSGVARDENGQIAAETLVLRPMGKDQNGQPIYESYDWRSGQWIGYPLKGIGGGTTSTEMLGEIQPSQIPTDVLPLGLSIGGGAESKVELSAIQQTDAQEQIGDLWNYIKSWKGQGNKEFAGIKVVNGQIEGIRIRIWPAVAGGVAVAAFIEESGDLVTTISANFERQRVAKFDTGKKVDPVVMSKDAWKLIMKENDGGVVAWAGETFVWVGPGKDFKLTIKEIVDPRTNEWVKFEVPTPEEELKYPHLPLGNVAPLTTKQLLEAGVTDEVIQKYAKLGWPITWVSPAVKDGKLPIEQGIMIQKNPRSWLSTGYNTGVPGSIISEVSADGKLVGEGGVRKVVPQVWGVVESVVKNPVGRGYYLTVSDTKGHLFMGSMGQSFGKPMIGGVRQDDAIVVEEVYGGFVPGMGMTDEQIVNLLTPGRVVMADVIEGALTSQLRDANGVFPLEFVFIVDSTKGLLNLKPFKERHAA